MVTKKQIRLVKDLQQKKYRNEHGLFVVEGIKIVKELVDEGLHPFKVFSSISSLQAELNVVVEFVSETELKKMSGLSTNNGVIGIFEMPKQSELADEDWILALDAVRDPGNLGTIIRLCDWFGIRQLVCSSDTVDCYNPKVLQATMGSIARVNIRYTNLVEYLAKSELPIFGTFINGPNIYDRDFPKTGILVMGNEANGISREIENAVNERIAIPQFGNETTESLNVATATAIFLSELRRTSFIRK